MIDLCVLCTREYGRIIQKSLYMWIPYPANIGIICAENLELVSVIETQFRKVQDSWRSRPPLTMTLFIDVPRADEYLLSPITIPIVGNKSRLLDCDGGS